MKIKNKEMERISVKKTLVLVIILGLVLANFATIASASPDLTEAGKDYIATNFGLGTPKCYVASGLSWSYLGTDGNTYPESGGTGQIVSRLVMTALVTSLTISGTTYTYADLKAGNENTDVTLEDAKWIAENDGDPATETQYCISVTPTSTPTPIPSTPSPTPSPTPTQTSSPSPIYTLTPTHTPTSSPISSPSPTPTLIDSDDDGVPDRYDYAPYDPNVQTKGDIKPETTPTPQPPGFEVLFVIVGLLLVAYLIKRRKVK